MKRAVTVVMLALLVCVAGYAAIVAPSTVAYRDTCHSTKVSLKSKDTVKARKALTLTVSTEKSLKHGFQVTLQYRKATSSTWRAQGAVSAMTTSPWKMAWKAPKTLGKYKLRVKVQFSDDAGTETTYTNVKTVKVTN